MVVVLDDVVGGVGVVVVGSVVVSFFTSGTGVGTGMAGDEVGSLSGIVVVVAICVKQKGQQIINY